MALTSEQVDMILLDMEGEGLLVVMEDGGFEPTEKGLHIWAEELNKRAAMLGVKMTIMTN
jgi:hypothetical protein